MNENEKEIEYVICFSCGEEIDIEEAYELKEGVYFCNEEESKEYVVCRECDEVVHKDNANYDRQNEDYVCDDCFSEEFCYCEDCGEIISLDDSYTVTGEHELYEVCASCIDNYEKCIDCGEYFDSSRGRFDESGNFLCDDCYDGSYCTCADCGDFVRFGEALYCEEEGEYYCDCCFYNNGHDEDSKCIHNYSYKPEPQFYNSSDSDSGLYMGIELEVDCGGKLESEAEEITNILDFAYCKSDGSLTNGFEIVTHPCTLEFHMNIANYYQEAFDELVIAGYRSHDTDTCGLHVHVNRDYFGDNNEEIDLNIAKLMLLIDKEEIWQKVVKFTRRKSENLNSWARRCNMPTSEEGCNEECIINESKRFKHNSRYYAINLQNSDTVEFRLFRGTLKYNTFIATLQFVSNVINLAKSKSLQDILHGDIKFVDIINFKEYEELNSYCREKGLI